MRETSSPCEADSTQGHAASGSRALTILHCLRAPVGGLFRHVCDLVRGQSAAGHCVGVICDSSSIDGLTEQRLAALAPFCESGIHRISMHRQIAPSDVPAALQVRRLCSRLGADVVHGHGAKGGAYARCAAMGRPVLAFYTPHGGSLHYSPRSPVGFVFLRLEALLSRATDGVIFESGFSRETYLRKVGEARCETRVIHNGLDEGEFEPRTLAADAADFLYVGELRMLKGVDVLLRALAEANARRPARAVIVGDGTDAAVFRNLTQDLGLAHAVSFTGAMPAHRAFELARTIVVPSRAESFPYIVLEAIGAGVPVIATDVGGIPEIFGEEARGALVSPGDVGALSGALLSDLEDPTTLDSQAQILRARARTHFSVTRMVASVTEFYRDRADEGQAPHASRRPAPAE